MTLTRDGVEVVIGEARAHVERDAWLSRGTRRTMGVLLDEIDRLRALPVLRTCGSCVHLYRRGRSCEHPTAVTPGEARRVDPSHEPPSWCPWRGGEVKGGDEDTKSSEPYYALGIREEAELSGRTPAEVQAEFVEWRRRKHEKGGV